MTAVEALRLVAKIEAAYRQSWPLETKTVYVERLVRLDEAVARAAIDEAIGEKTFAPTVAEVLSYAEAVAAERAAKQEVRNVVTAALPATADDTLEDWIRECDRLLEREDFRHYRPYVEAKRAALMKLRDAGGQMTPEIARQMLADITNSLGGDRRERVGV